MCYNMKMIDIEVSQLIQKFSLFFGYLQFFLLFTCTFCNFVEIMISVFFLFLSFLLLYSWRFFFCYSAPIHWLLHGHMTSNNETVSRQMPWAGNIAKTVTPDGKQFTVTREMLTSVARDQSVQLKVAWCYRWNLRAFFKICFCFVLLYHFVTVALETRKFVSLESQCFQRRSLGKHWDSRETKFTIHQGNSH